MPSVLDQLPKVFPFYLVCDVSASLHHPETWKRAPEVPLDAMAQAFEDVFFLLRDDEAVGDLGLLSLIVFGDTAEVLVPLTFIGSMRRLPTLPRQVYTNYKKVFELLDATVRSDVARLAKDYRVSPPVVYFISDGEPLLDGKRQPLTDWLPARQQLDDPLWEDRPYIVSLGVGKAAAGTVALVASRNPRGVACIADGSVPLVDLIRRIISQICASVTASIRERELVFDAPAGMRRLS